MGEKRRQTGSQVLQRANGQRRGTPAPSGMPGVLLLVNSLASYCKHPVSSCGAAGWVTSTLGDRPIQFMGYLLCAGLWGRKHPERLSLCPQGVYRPLGRGVTEEPRVSQGAGEGGWPTKQGVSGCVWFEDGGEGEGPPCHGCGKHVPESPRGWQFSRHPGGVLIKTSLARWWHSVYAHNTL